MCASRSSTKAEKRMRTKREHSFSSKSFRRPEQSCGRSSAFTKSLWARRDGKVLHRYSEKSDSTVTSFGRTLILQRRRVHNPNRCRKAKLCSENMAKNESETSGADLFKPSLKTGYPNTCFEIFFSTFLKMDILTRALGSFSDLPGNRVS
jgi:hypothetical protein